MNVASNINIYNKPSYRRNTTMQIFNKLKHNCGCFRSRLPDFIIFVGSENTFSTEPKQTLLHKKRECVGVLHKIDAKSMHGSCKNHVWFSKKALYEVTRTSFGFQRSHFTASVKTFFSYSEE